MGWKHIWFQTLPYEKKKNMGGFEHCPLWQCANRTGSLLAAVPCLRVGCEGWILLVLGGAHIYIYMQSSYVYLMCMRLPVIFTSYKVIYDCWLATSCNCGWKIQGSRFKTTVLAKVVLESWIQMQLQITLMEHLFFKSYIKQKSLLATSGN